MENKLDNDEIDSIIATVVRGIMDDTIKTSKAKEVSNAIGKQLSKDIARMQYCVQTGSSMEIPSLGITDSFLSLNTSPVRRKLKGKQNV